MKNVGELAGGESDANGPNGLLEQLSGVPSDIPLEKGKEETR